MSTPRFSKKQLREDLLKQEAGLRTSYNFIDMNGTAQLKPGDINRAVQYGHWMRVRHMLDNIGWRS